MLKDFRAFILRGNVVDLAVGIVIGAAFGTVITSLVKNILTPCWPSPAPSTSPICRPRSGGRHPLRHLPQRPDRLLDHRRRHLLLRGAPGQRPHGPASHRARRRGDHQGLPPLPELDPPGRKRLRLLHQGRRRRLRLSDLGRARH